MAARGLATHAADLFKVCDYEEKGFVTKRDMQRMRKEFPLEPDQLETVFDTLDIDANGYLTLDEFTAGFAKFLGLEESGDVEKSDQSVDDQSELPDDSFDEEDEQFEMLLDELGIRSVIGPDDQALKSMWNTLKLDPNPEMMANFEQVLSKLTGDVQKKTVEQETLESTIRSRTKTQEEHMSKLYEEMELQIEKERQDIRAEEERKEKRLQKEYESLLQIKDSQMQSLQDEKERLKDHLEKLSETVPEMKEEKDLLVKERNKLEKDLEIQRRLARDLQDQVDSLRQQTDNERKERAKAAFRVTENIALEREGIVSELDKLRYINTKIMDEQDSKMDNGCHRPNRLQPPESLGFERNLFSDCEVDHEDDDDDVFDVNETDIDFGRFAPSQQRVRLEPKQPEVVKKFKPAETTSLLDEIAETLASEPSDSPPMWLQLPTKTSEAMSSDQKEDLSSFEDYETRPQYIPKRVRSYPLKRTKGKKKLEPPHTYSTSLVIYTSRRDETTTEESDTCSPPSTQKDRAWNPATTEPKPRDVDQQDNRTQTAHKDSKPGLKAGDSHVENCIDPILYQPVKHPERIFKVIFIGDSTVGKTSLITRFCKGQFLRTGMTSTVGINFQTRTLLIDTTSVCLQCWDTAGQERYRSMTRQFFRKSDAAVVVYDVTSETSFLNARQWLDSAQESIVHGDESSNAEFLLLGNKVDLADDDLCRKVRKADGLKLARVYSTLFHEVSAADGRNVEESLTGLARLLSERQDFTLEKTIKLSKQANQNKNCC